MQALTAARSSGATSSIVPLQGTSIALTDFVRHFRSTLLQSIANTNPPVYTSPSQARQGVLDRLKRKPFPKQADCVQALAALLLDRNEKASVLNAEMGTGKTMMAICLAALLDSEGIKRHLVIAPPHLVYKWRREILDTLPSARVWVINGPDAIAKLIKLQVMFDSDNDNGGPLFVVLGRVRMRMGFHWRAAINGRVRVDHTESMDEKGRAKRIAIRRKDAACANCGTVVVDDEGDPIPFELFRPGTRMKCMSCCSPLWTLMRPGAQPDVESTVKKFLTGLPTIGTRTADRLLGTFGASFLGSMIEDNLHEFTNLLDAEGNFIFTERQADRLGRVLAKVEFSLNGGAPYQPTEFIKRYMRSDAFGLLIADEAHEYKSSGSAQGQAFAVLAGRIKKVLLLTGTLMGGYADDLFYLLFRAMPHRYLQDGFRFNAMRTLGTAAMAFMSQYGVLKSVTRRATSKEDEHAFKTAKGKKSNTTVSRSPGFSPKGLARYVLPYTVFLKLKDVGQTPPYEERYVDVPLPEAMRGAYDALQMRLVSAMREALRHGDHTLVGVVLNCLLAWPETCFRDEMVRHPRTRHTIALQPALYTEADQTPKEKELLALVRDENAAGRRVLIYTTYTDTRDITTRLKSQLAAAGVKAAVLRSTVSTEKREDWILDQVDNGVEALITNPELVKTGLDLLEFPTIVFLTTGYSVYTLQQAARRSWRIGQKLPVRVYFMGYAGTAQATCLKLMAKKISVSQSTSGEMPATGLDALNDDTESIEIALARELMQGDLF